MSQDSAIAAYGQQVITACAVVNKFINGKPSILVAKRAATKKFLPGKYELPGVILIMVRTQRMVLSESC